jgi:hypothetical protein
VVIKFAHWKFPETSLILYHKSPSNLKQYVWSILQKAAGAQPGLKEGHPHHLAMHCCGNLGAHVSEDSSELSCRYPSASRPITSSKILIIQSHQSSAIEMANTALGIHFYFFFPKIIFSAEILTVHFINLIPLCVSQVKIAPVHTWQTSRPHSHAYYSVNKNILW